MIKRINVEHLEIGMFVEKLDRPWLGTPFPLQSVEIKSMREIYQLKKLCRFVYVNSGSSCAANKARAARERSAVPLSQSRVNLAQKKSFAKNLNEGRAAYRKISTVVKNLHGCVRAGRRIDLDAAVQAIDKLLPLVAKNRDAMIWLSSLMSRHEYTANHSINVCLLSLVFGNHLGLDQEQLKYLGTGALLHDLGKLQVSRRILNKSGPLTDAEYAEVRRHPEFGAAIASSAGVFDKQVIDIIRHHHEYFAGGGYPSGDAFNRPQDQLIQIVAIADVYDALTSERVYRAGIAPDRAMKILQRGAGTQFNPILVEEFIQCYSMFPSGSLVELSSGEVGIKLFNSGGRSEPVVLIVLDTKKRAVYPLRMIDFKFFEQTGEPYSIRNALDPGTHGVKLDEYVEELIAA